MKLVFVLGHEGNACFLADRLKAVSIFRGQSPDHESLVNMTPDLVLFAGGEDIANSLYLDPNDHAFSRREGMSKRDVWEQEWFNWCVAHKVAMFGICRGMQMITALSGGKLIDHVDNHHGGHPVTTNDGNRFKVNSIHHQMCLPKEGTFELLAYAYRIMSPKYLPDTKFVAPALRVGPAGDFVEPEALWFPKHNALGVQWHPEMLDGRKEFTQANEWVVNQIHEYLNI
jgi:putative glutamine amidotransferase